MRAGCKLAQLKPQVNRSEKEDEMSQINHSFGDGPPVLSSGLFLLTTIVGELGEHRTVASMHSSHAVDSYDIPFLL